jgi:hypothetical protein
MDRPRDLRRWAVVLILATSLVAACKGQSAEEPAASGAATVEPVKGTDTSEVTLTEDAARRLDVQTAAVSSTGAGTQIPYAAVLYDPNGKTWAFVNLEGRTFVRESITVDRIDGERAFLKAGPAAGAKVVTVGGAEIYGAELGVGDDE